MDKKHEKIFRDYLNIKDTAGIHEEKLWNKVKKYNKIFSYIPGVLCVCVGNSLAMNAAHKDSDIDLFIITKSKRIWTTRILITALLGLLGERKTSKKHTGKFCLSFFITQNQLSLENIAIKNDIYLHYWIKALVPVINKNNTFEQFIIENSSFFSLDKPINAKTPVQKNTYLYEFLTKLGDVCEKILKNIFLPRTKKSFQKLGKPYGVVISDDMLKFHDKDRRKEIRDAIFY
ncbi:nucleotidyltransferase domain-containing protein [Candidatus Gracilibacteria bacterium]|nr:nucleotidyltransferase domain-containing protein [Candidatus Gracilibacteria bacterium]